MMSDKRSSHGLNIEVTRIDSVFRPVRQEKS